MYYFDNKFLMYYLNLDTDLKVYVNGEYLDISDAYDVSDPFKGFGYTIYGESRQFDYRDIEHLMIGNKTFNLDQLEKAYSSDNKSKNQEKPAEEKPAEEKPAEEKPAEEKPAEEKPAEEPTQKEESVQMHSFIQNIDPTHSKFMTRGSVIMLDEGWVTYEYYSINENKLVTATVKRNQVKVI
jgi:flagellar biosynthesis GTPase FlhF